MEGGILNAPPIEKAALTEDVERGQREVRRHVEAKHQTFPVPVLRDKTQTGRHPGARRAERHFAAVDAQRAGVEAV